MGDITIRVENLGKRYRIGTQQKQANTLRESLQNLVASPFDYLRSTLRGPSEEEILWALRDVSFEVKRGEVVGIIGRNGAGKTTLLRILSRITEPTEGRAIINGRVGSLLEVGTGFHPELTGRENIYMNGAILGMKRAEIEHKFDEIVDFSGVEKFIDTPVKRYSSGMYVRLAFAVAAHLEPEILLVDEVLAVGDAEFQKKCLGKMQDVAGEGRTVLFVSHNMGAIERLCTRAILLDDGKVAENGPVRQVIARYLESGSEQRAERVWTNPRQMPGDSVARLRAVRARNKYGEVTAEFAIQEPISIEMEFDVLEPGHVLETDFYFYYEGGVLAFLSKDYHGNEWANRVRPTGRYREMCRIPGNFLNDGRFTVLAGITTPGWIVHASARDVISFRVVDDFSSGARGGYKREWPGGVVRPLLQWTATRLPSEEGTDPAP